MSVLREPNGTADYDRNVVAEAYCALIDGHQRVITPRRGKGDQFVGWVWEIYRSIETQSIRIRFSDFDGRVYHFNSKDVVISAGV